MLDKTRLVPAGPRPAALLGGVTRRLVEEARCPVAVLSGEPRTSIGALVG